MTKLIGLSLSNCVNDIAAGRVKYDAVEKVIARTALKTEGEVERAIATYQTSAWIAIRKKPD